MKWIISLEIVPIGIDEKIYRSTTLTTQEKFLFELLFSIICEISNKTVMKMLFIKFSLIEKSQNKRIKDLNE